MIFLFALLLPPSGAQTPRERATALLAKMTLDDKVAMLHGFQTKYVGTAAGNPTLGIPELRLSAALTQYTEKFKGLRT
jgi:hypothetical protein